MKPLLESAKARRAAEMLRRYWHPIGLAKELKNRPLRRRLLGEDLVLFCDDKGRIGLIGQRCPRRGTSLEFGHIEDGGLRGCPHGWLFDVEATILEMRGEPMDSTFNQSVTESPLLTSALSRRCSLSCNTRP